ncbi:MAG: inositol monophosphatase, partial [Nitrospirae bacterium]
MTSDQLPPLAIREELKTIAIRAAWAAGSILQEHARHGFRVEHKDSVNLVTDADRRAEEAIVHTIRVEYPSHQVLAEERGLQAKEPSPFKWVIDPLDGTTNFAHGFPAYCVSIGLEYQGRGILGVVFDPTRQELFVAEAGRGAFLNGTQIHVSRTPKLDAALLVTGFAYDIRE